MSDPYKFLSSLGQAHLVKCISIILRHDEDRLKFFFSHKEHALRRAAKNLIEEASTFEMKEQLKIRVCLDLWNKRGAAHFADLLTEWDHEEWVYFLIALCEYFEVGNEVFKILKKTYGK